MEGGGGGGVEKFKQLDKIQEFGRAGNTQAVLAMLGYSTCSVLTICTLGSSRGGQMSAKNFTNLRNLKLMIPIQGINAVPHAAMGDQNPLSSRKK